MENDWLAASSFERTHEILSAINTLSIHAKLAAVGATDTTYADEVGPARERILTFLDELERLSDEIEMSNDDAVVGTDPRMGDLTRRFLAGKKSLPRKSPLFALPTSQLRALIAEDDRTRIADRISCLAELRALLEQHVHADAVGLLGNL